MMEAVFAPGLIGNGLGVLCDTGEDLVVL